MADIKVVTTELHDAANKIREKAGEFEADYSDLITKATAIDDIYASADSKVFLEKMQGLKKKLEDMNTQLNNLANIIEKQGQNYDERIQANVNSANNLPS